jgi:hypothetical protein
MSLIRGKGEKQMEIPVACTLSKADLSKRQDELDTLRQAIRGVRQTPDGFALRFDSSTENLMAIAQLIDQERVCCRFLQFRLILEQNAGSLWLEVSGLNDTLRLLLELFITH